MWVPCQCTCHTHSQTHSASLIMWLSMPWLVGLVPYSFPFHYSSDTDSDFGALKFSSIPVSLPVRFCVYPEHFWFDFLHLIYSRLLATHPSKYIRNTMFQCVSIGFHGPINVDGWLLTLTFWWMTLDFNLGTACRTFLATLFKPLSLMWLLGQHKAILTYETLNFLAIQLFMWRETPSTWSGSWSISYASALS